MTQDYDPPDLATAPHAVPVDPTLNPIGVHGTYQITAGTRSTEAAAVQTLDNPLPVLSAEQVLLLDLELDGMKDRVDQYGKTIGVGMRGMPLYLWICKRLRQVDGALYRHWKGADVLKALDKIRRG